MLTHHVEFLMTRLRGLNNKGYQYCELAVKQAPSYKEVRGKMTIQLLSIFCVHTILVSLPIVLYSLLELDSGIKRSFIFALSLVPCLVMTFFNLAKWSAWLSFTDEVHAQSYRFRKIKRSAANSRHSLFLIGINTVVLVVVSMAIHLLIGNGQTYILLALLPAVLICNYLGGLASIRTAYMMIVSGDISRFKEDYEG